MDDQQPTGSMASRPILSIMVVSITAIVVALLLGFLDVIPLSLAFAVVLVAITVQTVVAWSAERQPASWTAAWGQDEEDEDEDDDDEPRR